MKAQQITKTVKEVLEEIKDMYGDELDARVLYYKIDVKREFSRMTTVYNEREANKRLANDDRDT